MLETTSDLPLELMPDITSYIGTEDDGNGTFHIRRHGD